MLSIDVINFKRMCQIVKLNVLIIFDNIVNRVMPSQIDFRQKYKSQINARQLKSQLFRDLIAQVENGQFIFDRFLQYR